MENLSIKNTENYQIMTVTKDTPMMEYPLTIKHYNENTEYEYYRLPKGLLFCHNHYKPEKRHTTPLSFWTCFRLNTGGKWPGWLKNLSRKSATNVISLGDLYFLSINFCIINQKYIGDFKMICDLIRIQDYYSINIDSDTYNIDSVCHLTKLHSPSIFDVVEIGFPATYLSYDMPQKKDDFFYELPCICYKKHHTFRNVSHCIISKDPEIKAIYDTIKADALRVINEEGSAYTQYEHPCCVTKELMKKYAPEMYIAATSKISYLSDILSFCNSTAVIKNDIVAKYTNELKNIMHLIHGADELTGYTTGKLGD